MKELVVISGKGGTGKTSLVAAFASLSERKALADCDVDAPDLPIVLAPRIRHQGDFTGGKRARIDAQSCTGCGECRRLCRFDAVRCDDPGDRNAKKTFWIDAVACEGCGVCVRFCPENAVVFEEVVNGQWFISDTRHGPMVHARMAVAGENSGKLVSAIRRQARKIAEEQGLGLVIIDGSPGIGCPVIASIAGVDLALVVTEPTLSGAHDFGRVAQLTDHFGVPTLVCVNKWDINPEMTARIEEMAQERGIGVVGRVRYDPAFTQAQVRKATVIEHTDGPVAQDIRAVWRKVTDARQTMEGGRRSEGPGIPVETLTVSL